MATGAAAIIDPPPRKPSVQGTPGGAVGTPRYFAVIDNRPWPELIHIELNQRSYNAAATFTIDAVLSLIAQGVGKSGGTRLDELLAIDIPPERRPIDIYGGYTTDLDTPVERLPLPLLFSGYIDHAIINQSADLLSISGRDKSAAFVESFIHQQLRNQTTGGVVKEIGQRHGFDVSHVIDTGLPVGQIYEYDSISTNFTNPRGLNEWSVLQKLAEADGFALFVLGNSLFYQPFERFDETILFVWGENITHMQLEKNYGINSSRCGVELSTTRLKTKEGIVAQSGPTRGSGDAIVYRYVAPPGLDAAMLQELADWLALLHAQFEFIAVITTVGDPVQSMRNQIELVGTPGSSLVVGAENSGFDGFYRPLEINWHFGPDQAWTSEIHCIKAPKADLIRQRRKKVAGRLGSVRSF